MPLEVVKLSRSNSCKFAKKNFIAHQTEVFVQAKTCTIMVTKFMQFVLFKVYLKDIKEPFNNCVILADKGCLSADYQLYLFESKQIKLEVPMRKNQHNYKKQTYIFRKKRKRIETLFSQLCDQFMIRRNYAKSFQGFKTRILSKLTSLTVIQYITIEI